MVKFAFQLHKIEIVQSKSSEPYGDDKCLFSTESEVKSVPVLHIFGRKADGSSVCAKIRNTYPYFYVELSPSDVLVPSTCKCISFQFVE